MSAKYWEYGGEKSLENKNARILAFQLVFGAIAGALAAEGVFGNTSTLVAAFTAAAAVAGLFFIPAMADSRSSVAVTASSLAAALAVLCLLTAAPFFAAASALVSIAMASLAAGLARYDWIVGEEHFLLTVLRALPVVSLFAPLVDLAVREKAR